MDKLAIINNLPIEDYDADGETLYFALTSCTDEVLDILAQIGATEEEINQFITDDKSGIDISYFAFQYCGANWFDAKNGFQKR